MAAEKTEATARVASVLRLGGACTLFGPVFLFFFHCHIEFNRIETHDFQLGAAVRAFDDIAFVSVFVDLDFSITLGASSSWHLLYSSSLSRCAVQRSSDPLEEYLNRNASDLQEAGDGARTTQRLVTAREFLFHEIQFRAGGLRGVARREALYDRSISVAVVDVLTRRLIEVE